MFYFKEGFCWTDINSIFLKARIKNNGIFDVVSMSLFSQTNIPDWYFVCMINSTIISFYVQNFLNNTSHFQINDARQLPIVIPDEKTLLEFKNIFTSARDLKYKQFSNKLSKNDVDKLLNPIQLKLDELVENLYLTK